MAAKIGKDILISELVSNYPEAVGVLTNHGFHCIGCGLAGYETLGEGAAAHGYDEAETDKIVEEINNAVSEARELEATKKGQKEGGAETGTEGRSRRKTGKKESGGKP